MNFIQNDHLFLLHKKPMLQNIINYAPKYVNVVCIHVWEIVLQESHLPVHLPRCAENSRPRPFLRVVFAASSTDGWGTIPFGTMSKLGTAYYKNRSFLQAHVPLLQFSPLAVFCHLGSPCHKQTDAQAACCAVNSGCSLSLTQDPCVFCQDSWKTNGVKANHMVPHAFYISTCVLKDRVLSRQYWHKWSFLCVLLIFHISIINMYYLEPEMKQ